ncbi:MAG: TonB family protein, partial [Deferribacteres bacterium]|nr:TonB family protein [Deferribacteres bacterium]
MKRSLHIGKEPDLQKIVIVSAILHLLFIMLVTIPIKTRERQYRSYSVRLVAPAEIRGEARRPPPAIRKRGKAVVKVKPTPRRRVRPQKGVSLEPPAQRVAKEIERLRAISALAKRKKEKEAEEEAVAGAIENIRKKKLGRVSSVAGTRDSADSDAYGRLISRIIKSHWGYPVELRDSDLEVIILFRMDEKGNIIFHRIEKSSGSRPFDRSAVKAVLDSSPLPP